MYSTGARSAIVKFSERNNSETCEKNVENLSCWNKAYQSIQNLDANYFRIKQQSCQHFTFTFLFAVSRLIQMVMYQPYDENLLLWSSFIFSFKILFTDSLDSRIKLILTWEPSRLVKQTLALKNPQNFFKTLKNKTHGKLKLVFLKVLFNVQ